MCGFPDFSLEKHVTKLVVEHKYTIAVYDQQDIEGKKEKNRVLREVVSPSTYLSDDVHISNELLCITIDSFTSITNKTTFNHVCMSSIDVSTGKSRCSECIDNKDNKNLCMNEVKRWIYTICPCEIIIIGKTDSNIYKDITNGQFSHIKIHHRDIDKKYYNLDYQKEFMNKIFDPSTIHNQFNGNGELLGCYLYMLQFAFEHDPLIIQKLNYPSQLHTSSQLYLNNDCIYQLNLFTQETNQTSSLFNIINKTNTKMGFRLVKDRLMNPICDEKVLQTRYDKIESVWDSLTEYKPILSNILDIEKKYRKMVLKRLVPHEFANLDTSFKNISQLFDVGKASFNIKKSTMSDLNSFIEDYHKHFDISKMERYNEISYVQKGIDKEIDCHVEALEDIMEQFRTIQTWMMDISAGQANIKIVMTERDGMHFSTTKKCWEKIQKAGAMRKCNGDIRHGWSIDETNALHEGVRVYGPGNWAMILQDEKYSTRLAQRTNTDLKDKWRNEQNKKTEPHKHIQPSDIRCTSNKTTVKLKTSITDKLFNTYEHHLSLIKKQTHDLFMSIMFRYETDYNQLFEDIIQYVSDIDLTVTFASISKKNAYTKPSIHKSKRSYVKAEGLRHPIIEKIHDDVKYIPNDVHVDTQRTGYLVYGLNSSGKSTHLRSIGSNIVLAQIGMFVAASSFQYHPYKKLLTKISTTDNIFKGQSTFVVEMTELNEILTKSDEYTLVLCDELTSGTETNSATGLVASCLKYLLEKKVHFLMTTHLHGIMEFKELVEDKKLYVCHFDILIKDKGVECDRKLKDGSGRKTYGIEIAKVIGLDKTFIKDAYAYRARYEDKNMDFLQNKRSRYNKKVIMDCCKLCGSKKDLHTHHICEQQDADRDGVIDKQFHKNVKHNLLVVCETCHQKIHN